MFLRPAGTDLEACFSQLPFMTSEMHLARLRELCPLNEAAADESRVKYYNDSVIGAFVRECHGLLQALTVFKN